MNNFKRTLRVLNEKQTELVSKDRIMWLQAQYVKRGERISFDNARKELEAPIIKARKEAEKAAKAAARAARPKKPRAPRKKYITRAQFMKRVKGAGQDFVGDTASDLRHEFPEMSKQEIEAMAQNQLGDVAWDLAGSLMYDQEIDDFVRKELADWNRVPRERIRASAVQEYIADYIL